MVRIDNVSDAADQLITLQMPDGTTGTLELWYRGAIQRWLFDFTHAQFPNGAVQGQMLCVHPNILRNWENILDFGMACTSLDGQDPVYIEDFVNGRCSLYILDAADVQTVETTIYGAYGTT